SPATTIRPFGATAKAETGASRVVTANVSPVSRSPAPQRPFIGAGDDPAGLTAILTGSSPTTAGGRGRAGQHEETQGLRVAGSAEAVATRGRQVGRSTGGVATYNASNGCRNPPDGTRSGSVAHPNATAGRCNG